MLLAGSYFHMSIFCLSDKIKTLDNGWKVEMCKIPKEASARCFICLSDEEIEVCKSCDVGICYRHKSVHKNSDGQCYPFKVDIRGDLGKSLRGHYILRIIQWWFPGRILVATRNIRKGELIFKECPAVVGPYSRTRPQCLTCFRTFDQSHVYTCPRYWWRRRCDPVLSRIIWTIQIVGTE